jgi:16S rRNA (guanine527-N7)-methyltransferase
MEAKRTGPLPGSFETELGPLVDRVASAAGARLDDRERKAVLVWLDRLEQWNARIDLTAARSRLELVDIMLADALILSAHVARGARVIDVGAGSGAPGLALALLRSDLRLTLVEPRTKRASFLRTAAGSAGRSDVVIERARGQALAGRRAWAVAVSRATLPAQEWLELGVSLVSPGGCVWVLLAKDPPPKDARATLERDYAYTWPLTGAERRGLVYRVG